MKWLFSRSTVEAFHRCPRYGWWKYLALGQGIESLGVNEHLLQGTLGHEGLSKLLLGEDPLKVIPRAGLSIYNTLMTNPTWHEEMHSDAREMPAGEWQRLSEGLLWAVQRWVLPELLKHYRVLSVEESRIYWFPENPLLGCLAKPDVVLEPISEEVPPGQVYVEWKFCTPSKDWGRQYARNPQQWSGKLAFPEIENFMVIGLDKGNMYKGVRNSPFTYLYQHVDGRWSWETERTKGWGKVSTADYPGGLRQLVKDMPLELLQAQFVFTPSIPIDTDLMEEWRCGQLQEQTRIAETKALLGTSIQGLETLFPRWLDRCTPGGYQRPCGMLGPCHRHVDPLGSGMFQIRQPHHELEVTLRSQGEVL